MIIALGVKRLFLISINRGRVLEKPDKLLDSPLYSLVKQGEFNVTSTVTKPGGELPYGMDGDARRLA